MFSSYTSQLYNLRPSCNFITCLLPVRYQSIADLKKKNSAVRSKVSASPFFEKTEFTWVPLEDLVGWIKTGNQNPSIPGGGNKPISWRFFGVTLSDFHKTLLYGYAIVRLNI